MQKDKKDKRQSEIPIQKRANVKTFANLIYLLLTDKRNRREAIIGIIIILPILLVIIGLFFRLVLPGGQISIGGCAIKIPSNNYPPKDTTLTKAHATIDTENRTTLLQNTPTKKTNVNKNLVLVVNSRKKMLNEHIVSHDTPQMIEETFSNATNNKSKNISGPHDIIALQRQYFLIQTSKHNRQQAERIKQILMKKYEVEVEENDNIDSGLCLQYRSATMRGDAEYIRSVLHGEGYNVTLKDAPMISDDLILTIK